MNDVYMFNSITMAWTDISSSVNGIPPSRRYGHGFSRWISTFVVFGGKGSTGPFIVQRGFHSR